MNRKTKKIICYILGFMLTILLVVLIVLGVLKSTALSEYSVKRTLDKTNYYSLVSDKIRNNMKDYMTSSGLDEEILNDLFTDEDVRSDVNKYLDKLYQDSNIEFEDKELKEKLTNNINASLEKNNLQVEDQEAIDSFVTEMVKIYQKETNLYNLVDNFTDSIQKVNNLLGIVAIVLLVICIIIFITIAIMKVRCFGPITLGVAILLFYVRFAIYEKVDFKNILILSKEFSNILTMILTKIANYLNTFAIGFLVLGIVITLIETYITRKKRERARRHHQNKKKTLEMEY